MKTKFTKVAVSERLPSAQGFYLANLKTTDNSYSWMQIEFNNNESCLYYWSNYILEYYEESPDLEDEMREMLERIQDLDVLPIEIEDELSNLLQSLKQEK